MATVVQMAPDPMSRHPEFEVQRRSLALVALTIALSSSSAAAQSTQDNLDKYWRLRTRLTTEFLSVGPAQGQSQPAQERHEGQSFIKFGDTTLVLGWYIGVLATEYELVRQPGRFPGADRANATQVNSTLAELYYALLAMERDILPPLLWDGERDPDLPAVRFATPGESARVERMLSLSFAFGGSNMALVLGRG